jgi:hypothetical protein
MTKGEKLEAIKNAIARVETKLRKEHPQQSLLLHKQDSLVNQLTFVNGH